MRLLTLPFTLASKAVRGALGLVGGSKREPDLTGPTPTRVPPQPRYARAPEPPWDGYDAMNANDVRARLRREPPEAAAAVRLYEAAHKGRTSVLEAATRQLSARPSG
jgi:hypothetical protein